MSPALEDDCKSECSSWAPMHLSQNSTTSTTGEGIVSLEEHHDQIQYLRKQLKDQDVKLVKSKNDIWNLQRELYNTKNLNYNPEDKKRIQELKEEIKGLRECLNKRAENLKDSKNDLYILRGNIQHLKVDTTRKKVKKLKWQVKQLQKTNTFVSCLESIKQELGCCVCSFLAEDPVLLDCGHHGCEVCVKKWLSVSQPPTCPICREEFPEVRKNQALKNIALKFKKSN